MILDYVQPTKYYAPNEVESLLQVAPPIEAAQRWSIREQISVVTLVIGHHSLCIPSAALGVCVEESRVDADG